MHDHDLLRTHYGRRARYELWLDALDNLGYPIDHADKLRPAQPPYHDGPREAAKAAVVELATSTGDIPAGALTTRKLLLHAVGTLVNCNNYSLNQTQAEKYPA